MWARLWFPDFVLLLYRGYILVCYIYKNFLQLKLCAEEVRDFQKPLLTDHKTNENHATVSKTDLSA
jgi:hypothetical protein